MILNGMLEPLQKGASEECQQSEVAQDQGEHTIRLGYHLTCVVGSCRTDQSVHDLMPIFAIDQCVDRNGPLEHIIKVHPRVLNSIFLIIFDELLGFCNRDNLILCLVNNLLVAKEFHTHKRPNEDKKK